MIGGGIGIPFYIRYTIPAGLLDGDLIETILLTTSTDNSAANDGVLADTSGSNYAGITRSAIARTPASVPAPLPLFGAAAAFSTSRRLRRRLAGRG